MAECLEINEIPGYLEAVARERFIRDASFLPVTESIGGFEVLPMQLWHLVTLRAMRSPLLFGEFPSEMELAGFLWIMSPNYNPKGKGRSAIMKRCRKFKAPGFPLIKTKGAMRRWQRKTKRCYETMCAIVKAADNFVKEAQQDRPAPFAARGGFFTSYYSEAASVCLAIAKETGWSESEILHMPVKRVYQYLNALDQSGHRFNPSDNIVGEYLTRINRKN